MAARRQFQVMSQKHFLRTKAKLRIANFNHQHATCNLELIMFTLPAANL